MSTIPIKIMQWKSEYSVYDAVIDREHQALFDVFNRLHEAMLAGHGWDILATILADKMKLTEDHYAHEEKMMAAAHYPKLKAHLQLHEEHRKSSKDMVNRFERGETTITIEYMLLLSEWIKVHTMVDDRQFGEYMKARRDCKA